jgi:uncharacterized protein YndB with AHSA1/START domain
MWLKSLFGKKEANPAAAAGPSGSDEVVALERTVPLPPARAFALFTEEIGSWWPREYSWAGERLASMTIEPRMNGRCLEKAADGSVQQWGTVLAWHAPEHIVIAWQISPDRQPEPEPVQASRVDLRFSGTPEGGTRLLLVHRDFARHGEDWRGYRAKMAAKPGWPLILDRYVAAAK